jgi:DNA-binding NarL/FixJ family response regulator
MIRVLVVDDHAVVRRGLAEILMEASDIEVLGQSDSAAHTRALLAELSADVLVLDLGLPDSHGTAFIEELRREWPELRVLVLTIQPESLYAVRSVRSGASGYLTKRSAPAELVTAVRTIAQGSHYISPPVAEQLAAAVTMPDSSKPHHRLSDREYEVMVMLARGMSVGEIAQRLTLGRQTITTYRARVLQKLGMDRNSQVTEYALEHGLLV